MEKWILRNRNRNIEGIEELDICKDIEKILINRGFESFSEINEYINIDKNILKDAFKLKDLQKAIDILKEVRETQKKIRIVGDYDVDGVVSICILYKTFKDIGMNVDFVVPNRVKDGYGINKKIVDKAIEDGVDTLITCDNGTVAIDIIKYAKDNNLRVIVTDHHDIHFEIDKDNNISYIYPECDALINPKQHNCSYDFKKLCGAGVCFKLCSELYKIFKMEDKIEDLIPFVAIATVCDIVDLEGENRFFVKQGIEMIKNTDNVGLNAIIDVSQLTKENISTYEIGFIIGPSLNAAGRLDSAIRGIELLLCEDSDKAYEIAKDLKKLNDQRKSMTLDGINECIKIIKDNSYQSSKVIVLYSENIHESIAGIIAGRIKDKYYKPTIVLTKSEGFCKGSARSIDNINIFELLLDNKHLFKAFGGHPMAAGLSLLVENVDILRENLNKSDRIKDEDFQHIIYVDKFQPIGKIDYKFIKDLELLEPFGKANPKPLLGDKKVRLCSLKRIGKNKNYLSMKVISNDFKIFDLLYFGDCEEFDQKLIDNYSKEVKRRLYEETYIKDSNYFIDILYEVKIEVYNSNEMIKYFLYKYRF